jgi:HAD superfamily phosphoserine phosphatase-like hydrolase
MSKQKFAVFDIDGTIFRSHLYWEVILAMARKEKLHPELNRKTLELYDAWKQRKVADGFEVFDNETIHAIDRLLKELNPTEYDEIVHSVLKPMLNHIHVYPRDLMKDLKKKGYFLLAVSGSRIEEVSLFAKHHGFDVWLGQIYERTSDGKRYTGKVFKTYKDKHVLVDKLVKEHGLTYKDSYGMGDTGGDISMLERVDHPIAFNPNRPLLEHARKAGWKIVVERKNIIYHLEPHGGQHILA